MTNPDCYVRIVTPPGRAAVASVVLTGDAALEIVSAHFRPVGRQPFADVADRQIVFGHWGKQSDTGEGVVAARFRDRIEVHCHGGTQAVRSIFHDVLHSGAREDPSVCPWSYGDTERDDQPDRIRNEAVAGLTKATTERTAQVLLSQFQGSLRQAIDDVGQKVFSLAQDNQSRSSNDDMLVDISKLMDTWRLGQHLTQPFRVVMAGPPNVGKSSLMNALVGYERAIVYDQPGTTRDVLMAVTAIGGWPVQLCDTAGLGKSVDDIEQQGMARTSRQLSTADCIVIVSDVTQPPTEETRLRIQHPGAIVVRNKVDLLAAHPPAGPDQMLFVSALKQEGMDQILSRISQYLVPVPPKVGEPIVFTDRQYQLLHATRSAIQEGDYSEALHQLALLTSLATQ